MARITVEDCLENENNRFALVLLAAKRAKQILQGGKVLSAEAKGNKAIVSSLREIAEGQVGFMSPEEVAAAKIQEEREAEERAREAFEKLSQGESNGSALADKLRASASEDEEEEIEAAPEEDDSDDAEEADESEEDSSEDESEDKDTEEEDSAEEKE